MEFNGKAFDAFKKDLELAVKELEVKYAVEISTGKIKYSQESFTMEVKVDKTDLDKSVEQIHFELHCTRYGFDYSDYKLVFTHNGSKFELVGFNTKSPKNCCSIREIETKEIFNCSKELVRNALKR